VKIVISTVREIYSEKDFQDYCDFLSEHPNIPKGKAIATTLRATGKAELITPDGKTVYEFLRD
jgi:hypothetical protein